MDSTKPAGESGRVTAGPTHVDDPEGPERRGRTRPGSADALAGVAHPVLRFGGAHESTGDALGRARPALSLTDVVALQRSAGNSAVARLIDPARQEAPTAGGAGAGGLIVEDAATAGPGQQRKTEFLAELRLAVIRTANDVLAPLGRTAADCPYIEQAFSRYGGQSADQVERLLRRYAPDAATAGSARGYVAPVCAQVRHGVVHWAATGAAGPGPGATGGLMGGLSTVGSAVGGAVAMIGRLLFKSRAGGARPIDPAALRARMGPGRPLEGSARVRMESALGADFGAVRVHDDATAAAMGSELNARAFTIGTDVAFGAGEYRPGTPVGDALLAHELAHVMQQGPVAGQVQGKGSDADSQDEETHAESGLESAADRSAARAVLALWGSTRELGGQIAERAVPTVRSGLRLQRCGGPLSDSQEKRWLDQARARASGDLDKQLTTPSEELLALEALASQVRAKAAAKQLIPQDVLTPWDEAFRAIVAMQPKLASSGVVDEGLKTAAAGAMERFYANFRKLVAARDVYVQASRRSGIGWTKNPFLSEGDLKGYMFPLSADSEGILKRLRGAKTAADWIIVAADFHKVANGMDRYIAEQLRRDAKKDEAKTLAGKEAEAGDAIAKLEAALATGTPDAATRDPAKKAMESFATTLRSTVAHADYMHKVEPKAVKSTPPHMAVTNDFMTQKDLEVFLAQLRRAESAGDLRKVIAHFKTLRAARDRYLADEKTLGTSADADRLVHAGGVSRGIDELRQKHPDAQKVRTIFYPEPSEKEVDKPDYQAVAIPIELFLFREGSEWRLRDLTTPLEPKENKATAEPGKPPPLKALYEQLDSKLRFPRGLLSYRAADGIAGEQRTYAERELSDWLSMIGLTLAAVGLAVATMGASTPATALIILSSAAGAGAAIAAMKEKSEQGMLTDLDIAVGVSTVASEVTAGLTAGMGRLIVAGAGKTGAFARAAVLADRFYVPTTKIMIASNVVTFITVSAQAADELRKVEASGASEGERTLARERLTQQLLLLGGITMLGIKGDIASFKSGRNLYLDPDFAQGGMARAMLRNDELLARAKRLGVTSELGVLLNRKDLPQDLAHRLNAELSDALNKGRITDGSLRLVMNRMPADATPAQLETVLAELRKANRLVHAEVLGDKGKILIDEIAGRLRVRLLLADEDLFKRARALGTDNVLELALARKDFDAELRSEIRYEISTAMATGKIDDDGLRKIIGGLKKADSALQARQTLAELLHGNRVVATAMSGEGKVILNAVKDTEYAVGTKKLKIDPVHQADALYPGADGKAHLDEVKYTVNGLRSKLEKTPDQLANMKVWRDADPGGRAIKVVVESEREWTDLFRPIKGQAAPLKQLSGANIPLHIAGRELSAAQLDALWDAVEKKAKELGKYPPPSDFFKQMLTLAKAEEFLGITL